MEMPTPEQIDEAIAEAKRLGETPEQLEERIEAMCRLSDADLAAMGIVRAPDPARAPATAQPHSSPRIPGI